VDLIEGQFSLNQIRERLFEIPEFKNIIATRVKSAMPVRLIPVSSVRMDFVQTSIGWKYEKE
jgi:hypothetical protein